MNSAFFLRQFSMPPLARLAQLHDRLEGGARDALRTVLLIANDFVGAFASREVREKAEGIETRAELSKEFSDLERKGRALQDALEVVFFESFLQEKARRFLTF